MSAENSPNNSGASLPPVIGENPGNIVNADNVPNPLTISPISRPTTYPFVLRRGNVRSAPYIFIANSREMRLQNVRRNLFPSTTPAIEPLQNAQQPIAHQQRARLPTARELFPDTTIQPMMPIPQNASSQRAPVVTPAVGQVPEHNLMDYHNDSFLVARSDVIYYLAKLIEARRSLRPGPIAEIIANINHAFATLCQISFFAGGIEGDNMISYIEALTVDTYANFVRTLPAERRYSIAYNSMNESTRSTYYCRFNNTLMGAVANLVYGLKLVEVARMPIDTWLRCPYEMDIFLLVNHFKDVRLTNFFNSTDRVAMGQAVFERARNFYSMKRRSLHPRLPNREEMPPTQGQSSGLPSTSGDRNTTNAVPSPQYVTPQNSPREALPGSAALNYSPTSSVPTDLDDYDSDSDEEPDNMNSLFHLLKNARSEIWSLPNITAGDTCGYTYGKMFLSKRTLETVVDMPTTLASPKEAANGKPRVLICGICHTSVVNTVLDCGHMFCLPCLQNWFKHQPYALRKKYFIKCCHCRHEKFNFCKPIYDC